MLREKSRFHDFKPDLAQVQFALGREGGGFIQCQDWLAHRYRIAFFDQNFADDAAFEVLQNLVAPCCDKAALIDVCREEVPDAQFMWSLLGHENMADYYPGDKYVDIVGLSVFSLEPWERETLGRAQTFDDIFAPRYERALQFGKPIVIYLQVAALEGALSYAVKNEPTWLDQRWFVTSLQAMLSMTMLD